VDKRPAFYSPPVTNTKVAMVAAKLAVPWGGSEELWSRAAVHLVEQGFVVAASVGEWLPLHHRVRNLMHNGVRVYLRPDRYPLWKRVQRKILSNGSSHETVEVERFLSVERPRLVVLSCGAALPPITFIELCVSKGLRFVTIGQANHEGLWLEDGLAERYRRALPTALRCYFVSTANLRLAEKQIGCELPNAEVVRNPFNVDVNASPPWLPLDKDSEVRFACVARLHPSSKGQDLLLEALADPVWRDRRWHLTLYGDGPMRNVIERLVHRFNLGHRVTLAGFVPRVEDIWAANHALILPSRFEGLPLAMVEAMLCKRPVIATDVAGHSEIIEDGITGFLADAPTVPNLTRVLERVWDRRLDLEKMGIEAAKSIRKNVPQDPVKVFSNKIRSLLSTSSCSGSG
jgi:glycosyltransferase involved in cell wall biosynthesis